MRKIATVLLFGAFIFSGIPNAFAQPNRCDAVLTAKQHVAVTQEDQFLEAVARLSDRKALKESAEHLNIGIYDVIDADGDGWRRAKERVRKGQSRFTTRAHAVSFLLEGPATGAVDAWADCMKKEGPTFFAYIPNGSGTRTVGVTLYWSKGPNDPTPLFLEQPPHEVGVQQLTGDYTAQFRRPSASEGPREIVFNGRYAIRGQDTRYTTATVVLFPLGYFASGERSNPPKPIFHFKMRSGERKSPYLVVPRHYPTHERHMIELAVPPASTFLRLQQANYSDVTFVIEGPDGEITGRLNERETGEWTLGKHVYRLTCTEIDNGANGHLDWARFDVSVLEIQK